MGNKEECASISDSDGYIISQYASQMSNVTDVRGIARSGWCLPIECSQADFDWITTLEDNFVNMGIDMLPSLGINIDTLVFKTGLSNIFQRYVLSDVYDADWRARTQTGFYVTATLIGAVVFSTILANVYFAV